MHKFRSLIAATLLAGSTLAAPAALAAPVTYQFDVVHSRVGFYVSHLGYSNSLGQLVIAPGSFAPTRLGAFARNSAICARLRRSLDWGGL